MTTVASNGWAVLVCMGGLRRAPAEAVRRRQVVVRFSDAEFDAVGAAAANGGVATGAWIGDVAVRAAGVGRPGELGSLLRLHADVVQFAAHGGGDVGELLRRLDAAVEAVVASL